MSEVVYFSLIAPEETTVGNIHDAQWLCVIHLHVHLQYGVMLCVQRRLLACYNTPNSCCNGGAEP
jgi:hypothetical protein